MAIFGTNPNEPAPGTYNMLGIGGLLQGLNSGIQLGAHLGMQQRSLENEAGYRAAALGQRQQSIEDREQSIKNTASHQQAMEKILGGSANNADVFKKALLEGTMAPEQLALLGTGIAGAAARQSALGGALKEGYAPKKAQLEYAESKFEKTGPAETRKRVAQSVEPLLKQMETAIKSTNLSEYPALNRISSIASKQMGKTTYSDLEQKAGLISDEIQSMAGVGSDVKLKLIQGISDPTHQGKQQLLQGLQNIRKFVESRKEAFGGGGGKAPAANAATGPIHTYPSGKKVQWNGREWVPLNA